jgi:hypothetical protein
MPPDERQRLAGFFAGAGSAVQWVFLSAMLSTGDNPRTLYLTTTEREFMRRSEYDDLYGNWRGDPGMTLHYLDPGSREWITYRSLRLMHPPQAFRGRRLASPLERVSANPDDGQPLHPGEGALLQGLRVQKEEHERMVTERLRSYEYLHERFHLPDLPPEPAGPWQPFSQEATCLFCGQLTRDWWYINKAGGTCKCRPCKDKGLA